MLLLCEAEASLASLVSLRNVLLGRAKKEDLLTSPCPPCPPFFLSVLRGAKLLPQLLLLARSSSWPFSDLDLRESKPRLWLSDSMEQSKAVLS